MITSIGTYLPCWGTDGRRVVGSDEDAVTLAVAAGRRALASVDPAAVERVVFVSRDLPLLEGGNGAPVLAGLDLADHTEIREAVGGAPAVLDALIGALPGTLVIGSDVGPAAGAAAAWCDTSGAAVELAGRVNRNLPVVTRDTHGHSSDYGDARLLRVRGLGASIEQLASDQPIIAAAGVSPRDAAMVCGGSAPAVPTTGASSMLFAMAMLADDTTSGRVAAVEQATVVLADLEADSITVDRDEPAPRPEANGSAAAGADLPIALPAYERAFDAKLRLEASRCTACGTLAYPHRYRCLGCGSEEPHDTAALPRRAEIYTLATVHVPVPGLISPYTVVVAELGDTGVRTLVRLTGAEPGSVGIGDTGELVFRLVGVRSGVPDYGYGFLPDTQGSDDAKGVAA